MGVIREPQWLVAGLGNPGRAYARTRHNIGFLVVERLAAEAGLAFTPDRFEAHAAAGELGTVPVFLIKPQAFMNRSGVVVAAWLDVLGLPPERLVVAHDDLDLPLGRIRVVGAAGPGGHGGVVSIQEMLGTQSIPRVRVGIGRPREGEDAAERVLDEFAPAELPLVGHLVDRAAWAVRTLICEGLPAAMDRYNVRSTPDLGAAAQDRETPEGR